jgi:hypothetical protein
MIRLAGRLTAGGGRESLIRLVLTGAGLALAVTLLLFAAVAFPALHAHDVRRGWTETGPENTQPAQDESTTDPLLWNLNKDRFDGEDLVRVDVAALGPDSPVPPGLDALPGPGEIAVSPKLKELLATTDPALLGDRLPGEITATVGRDALVSPDDLVAFVGRAPDELEGVEGTRTVRSIESAPTSRTLTREMRIVFVVGGFGLLVPIIVFVATATRLAAARREQRLAALRLAGATQEQVGVVSAVEAAVAAVAGTVVGFVGFLAIRPALARIPFDGSSFYADDLHLSLAWAVTIAVGVPALAIGAAILSLRRIRISPLGVAQRARPATPTPRPLLLVVGGMAALAFAVVWGPQSDLPDVTIALLIAAPFVVMILGIGLSGPWLTALVGRGIARFGRGTSSLLAARRLQDNPAAGFRTISGIILAVFVGTVFSALASSMLANQHFNGSNLADDVVAIAVAPEYKEHTLPEDPTQVEPPGWRKLDPDRTAQLVDDLEAVDGVERVTPVYALPHDPELLRAVLQTGAKVYAPLLVSCDDAAALGLGFGGCEETTILNLVDGDAEPTNFSAPISVSELDSLDLATIAAVTDGRSSTIETARTLMEVGAPGTTAVTTDDIVSEGNKEIRTMQRVSNIGLSITLVIAGCSLAVAVAGAIVERKRPFTLLRLAGTRLSDLRRVVLAEAAAPLVMVAAASVALGMAVAFMVLHAGASGPGDAPRFVVPGLAYWLSLGGGLALALGVVLATLPLLERLTNLDSARFE